MDVGRLSSFAEQKRLSHELARGLELEFTKAEAKLQAALVFLEQEEKAESAKEPILKKTDQELRDRIAAAFSQQYSMVCNVRLD